LSRAKSSAEHRFRGVKIPKASHPDIKAAKKQGAVPSIHGNKLWKSSCLLIDYMKKNPPEHTDRVIDVGCGWGIAGIWCAKKLESDVTSVDADPNVFPFLQAAANLNKVRTKQLVSRFEKLTTKKLAKYDMLIAADICFWDDLVDPVSNMINRAVNAGVKQILIADPERAPFFEVAQRSMDKHCAEVVEWKTKSSIKASGSILVLHNA